MKAISISEPFYMDVVSKREPKIDAEKVLLNIQYIGLCGSDLNIYRGTMPMASYPRIPGHEISATIIDKGDNVPKYEIGQQVTLSPYSSCGVCPACRVGRTNTCEHNQTLGVQRDGALSERFAVHYSTLYSSEKLTLQEMALIEPISIGYHAANRAQVSETDIVLVLGCGTVGLGAIAASARKGAEIIAADIDDAKLDMAKNFGARHVINTQQQDPLEEIRNITNDDGVNAAIEAAGVPATSQLAIEAVAFAGRVTFVGYSKEAVSFDTKLIVKKELNVSGSRNALFEFSDVLKMLEQHRFPFQKLINRVYPFEQTEQAFHDWNENPALFNKILIDLTK